MTDDPRRDETRMRNQPAVASSNGAVWLVVGAAMAVVCGVVLVAQGVPAGTTGAVAVGALFAAMLATRLAVRRRQARIVALGVLLGLMPIVTLLGLGVVLAGR